MLYPMINSMMFHCLYFTAWCRARANRMLTSSQDTLEKTLELIDKLRFLYLYKRKMHLFLTHGLMLFIHKGKN